jgi:ribosomal protein S18 acetylase RimI-like enzyme
VSLERVLAFQRCSVELVAEQVEEIPGGWVARTGSLPAVWSLNHVRLSSPTSYEEAIAVCERHLGDLGYYQLYVDHEPSALTLAQTLGRQGWEVDVELHSVLVRAPDREADTSLVIEPDEDESVALMERWFAEDETLHLTAQSMRELLNYNTRTWRARDARRLGVRLDDGRLAAVTMLFPAGDVAQVEDVYTIPEARRCGYARALVTHATELARRGGHELTFIVADDNDWPKQLYAKLGFEPVGRTWLFHRDLRRDPDGA